MAGSYKHNAAFQEERLALLEAQREVDRAESGYVPNELLSGYRRLSERYDKLLREMYKVLHISDTQSMALYRLESELTALLDNAGQGFLTIDRSLKVLKPYSKECDRMFGRRIGGLPLAELIWPRDPDMRAKVEALLLRMMDPLEGIQGVGYSDGLPSSFEHAGMRIRIDFKRIGQSEDAVEPRIMIILTDMTEQAKSREQLEFLSTHDPLTGFFNRNYVDKWMSDYRKKAFAPLSMIITDMNGLKLVNDVYGHQKGDEMLLRTCSLIRRTFDEEAVCARWGGDEFLILLPGVGEADCALQIARLREACERTAANPIQISMAVGAATMNSPLDDEHQLFLQAEKMMYKTKLIESRNIRRKLIQEITESMYARGIEDREHVQRITRLAEGLAERLRLFPDGFQHSQLDQFAQLHDAGKIAIPEDVYRTRGKLTEDQWELIRTHSEIGYRLAYSLGEPALAEAILSLHENWNGQGYPYGLQGEQIPLLSRLFAIVDSYDVMTHDQPYRQAMSREAALAEVERHAGTQFDPRLARAFVAWQRGQ